MNAPFFSSRPHRLPALAAQRGSVLVTAMVFAAIIAISITSYLRVASGAMALSHRALYNNAAINIAETGLEEAMWSINQNVAGNSSAWTSSWSVSNTNVGTATFKGFDLGQNTTGFVRVYVSNTTITGSAPIIVARATVTPPSGNVVEKWIQVTLTSRSPFANGLVAKRTISFAGNSASVDSYNSNKGAYNANLGGGKFNKNDNGSAGSLSVSIGSFSLGNADIWGHVAIGTSDLAGLTLGPNGTVGPFGTSAGTVVSTSVVTNFTANFDDVSAPTPSSYNTSTTSVSGPMTLPLAGDTPASDGKYYYYLNSIGLSGNATNVLTITDSKNVVFLMTPTTGSAIDIKGNASINIRTGANLTIYTSADVSMAGNGVANSGTPSQFMLYGTRADGGSNQSIAISGNGSLSGVVYAPNADLSIKGGGVSGSVYGSMIGDTVTLTGNDAFHYDEALGEMTAGNPFGISNWNELSTAAARAAVTASVSF